MDGYIICSKCNGNGYLGNSKEPNQQTDCKECKNQGEILITEEKIWNELQFTTGRKQ